MNDESAVGIRYRAADLEEQADALPNRKPVAVTVGVDALAFDQLHHQVEQSLFGFATVQEPGHSRMIRRGQDLPFATKPRPRVGAGEAASEHLDGDILDYAIGDPAGAIDDRHATSSDLAEDLKCAEPSAAEIDLAAVANLASRIGEGGRQERRVAIEDAVGSALGGEEALDQASQLCVPTALAIEEALDLLGDQVEGRIQERIGTGPAFLVREHALRLRRRGRRTTRPWPGASCIRPSAW